MYHLNLLHQASGGRWKILRVSDNFKLVLVATFGHRDLSFTLKKLNLGGNIYRIQKLSQFESDIFREELYLPKFSDWFIIFMNKCFFNIGNWPLGYLPINGVNGRKEFCVWRKVLGNGTRCGGSTRVVMWIHGQHSAQKPSTSSEIYIRHFIIQQIRRRLTEFFLGDLTLP